ncbi:hypothetical protein C0585_02865 [Candidatus Woesearchaeota archaeon]|nr:MAG: hypothetical protein C0585_02865 [Candidatus Woesearchaeota archaeon]
MTEIIVIVALATNNCIGKDNDIPWRIKKDFQHFKDKTLGFPCIMGQRTYESLPDGARPLPGRENIVLTFDKEWSEKGITIMHDFNEAINYVKNKGIEKAFITGGASIYKLGLEVADKLELTRVHKTVDGDVFFPEIDFSKFEKIESRDDSEGEFTFTFETYKRKND